MSTPSWPTSLPQYVLRDGYREELPNTTLRTPMEVGPAKVRRRTSAAPKQVECQMDLNAEQLDILEGFYQSTTAGGSLAFSWPHPRTRTTTLFRFTSPPVFHPVSGLLWNVTLKLEILG
ncbi:MAG: hypothetical protein H7837_11400 [Magnetococcus sp. MYC-9]